VLALGFSFSHTVFVCSDVMDFGNSGGRSRGTPRGDIIWLPERIWRRRLNKLAPGLVWSIERVERECVQVTKLNKLAWSRQGSSRNTHRGWRIISTVFNGSTQHGWLIHSDFDKNEAQPTPSSAAAAAAALPLPHPSSPGGVDSIQQAR